MTTYEAYIAGEKELDAGRFMAKLGRVSNKLGKKAVEKLLVAYYVVMDPKTPAAAKATLVGALIYFGVPVDALPDVAPVVGFTDDVSVLVAALTVTAANVRGRHVKSARRTMRSWGFKVPKSNLPDDGPAGSVVGG